MKRRMQLRRAEDQNAMMRIWRKYSPYFHIVTVIIGLFFAAGICYGQYGEIKPKIDDHEARILMLEKDKINDAAWKADMTRKTDDIHSWIEELVRRN